MLWQLKSGKYSYTIGGLIAKRDLFHKTLSVTGVVDLFVKIVKSFKYEELRRVMIEE